MISISDSNDTSSLAQIISARGPWTPPVVPDCLSPAWEQEWVGADAQLRHNLAHAWLWYFDKDKQSNDTGWQRRLWNVKYRWIATVYDHVQNQMPASSQREACISIVLQKILSKSKPGSPMLEMWFGETQAQRMGLLAAGTISTLEDLGDLKYLAEDIGWGIALSTGLQEHRTAAVHLSVLSGLSGLFHSDHYPESIPWHMLGQYCARNLSSRPGLPFTMSINDLQKFIDSADAKMAAPVLGRLFQHSPSSALKVLLQDPGFINLEKEDVPEAAYRFLTKWLPAHRNTLVACAALGLPFIEACDQIAGTQQCSEAPDLPSLVAP